LGVEPLEGRWVPSTFTVLNTNDAGAGSLRNAVTSANANVGPDTIVFDNATFSTPKTITLTSGAITFAGDTALTTVTGPGTNLLSVSGGNTQGVFWVNAGISASLSGMTITAGSNSTGGGGVHNQGSLSLANCIVSNNASTSNGAGVFNTATLTMTGCVVTGNTASGGAFGGGVENTGSSAMLTMTDCSVSGNSAAAAGGVDNNGSATLTMINSTVSGNTTTSGAAGGVKNYATMSLTNVTISGNTSAGIGGGIFQAAGSATLTNVTISNNSALGIGGGGVWSQGSTFTLGNTILAGNSAASGAPDIAATISSTGNNLIGKTDGSAGWVGSDLTGTIATPLNPQLGAFADNGGLTRTMALLSGSPAINAGNNSLIPGGVTTDQRGVARILNGTVDIGAFEFGGLMVTNLTDVVNGTTTSITALLANPGADGVSLREALAAANNTAGADAIIFSAGLFAAPRTITLTGGQLSLTDAAGTTISGPGASLLTVSGNLNGEVFVQTAGASTIAALTVTQGSHAFASNGGAVHNAGGTLTLNDCVVTNNSGPGLTANSTNGGGVANTGTAVMVLNNCVISNNFGGSTSGGVYNEGTMTLTACTVSGNSADRFNGRLFNSGTLTLVNSTVSGNFTIQGGSLNGYGGGLRSVSGTMNLTNCTVSGNTSPTRGGGVFTQGGTVNVVNTIVAGNTAPTGPDVSEILTGTFSSRGNNLIGKTDDSAGWVASDRTGTAAAPLDAQLGALANNGGPTRTMALLFNSPAVSAGNAALAPAADQRGLARRGRTDIGAYEYQLKVTTTADGGTGSLRQAILDTNAAPGPDAIRFDLPGAGAHTIGVLSALPTITGQVVIDGTTQPGWTGAPVVELRGDAAGVGVTGLTIAADNSSIRGLVINRFGGDGIGIVGASGNTIAGNYIGTDVTGLLDRGNSAAGIRLQGAAANNVIGDPITGLGNVISGNGQQGVLLLNAGTGNVIADNIIGLGRDGSTVVRNDREGVLLSGTGGTTVGGTSAAARNVISGNQFAGVSINFAAVNTVVTGNYIGTDASGALDRGNGNEGVLIAGGSSNNTVGGTTAAQRNVISGNDFDANVYVLDSNNNTVRGNYIGTNAAGTAALGGARGVWVNGTSTGNVIGGTAAGAGNVISGITTNAGVRLSSGNTTVQGNFIGTNAAGTAPVPNLTGVLIDSGGANNLVGGAAAGAGNLIAGNSGTGVTITGATTTGNTLQANAIGATAVGAPLGNGGAGVLVTDAVANLIGAPAGSTNTGLGNLVAFNAGGGISVGGAAAGNTLRFDRAYGNTGFNVRVLTAPPTPAPAGLTSVVANPTQTLAFGTFAGAPNTTYQLDFYRQPFTATGQQARAWFASVAVTTNAAGVAAFNTPPTALVLPAGLAAGENLTAIATSPTGTSTGLSSSVQVLPPFNPGFDAPTSVAEGTPVTVTSRVTSNNPGAILSFAWTVKKNGTAFATGADSSVSFTPDDNGTYSVSLKVTDTTNGITATLAVPDLAVTNTAPVVGLIDTATNLPPAQTVTAGAVLHLGTRVTDPGTADTHTYSWLVNGVAVPGATGPTFDYTPAAGASVVTARVADDDGGVGEAVAALYAATALPGAQVVGAPAGSPEGAAVTVHGQLLGLTAPRALAYSWQVFKGTAPTPYAAAASTTAQQPEFTFLPNDNSTYRITLTVTDPATGAVATATPVTVSVTNVAPTGAVRLTSGTPAVGQPVQFTADVTDPGTNAFPGYPAHSDADPLGHPTTWRVVRLDGGGAFPGGTGPTFSFTPPAEGQYAVLATVTDKNGAATTASAVIDAAYAGRAVTVSGVPATNPPEGSPVTLQAAVAGPPVGVTFTYTWSVQKIGVAYAAGTGTGFTFTPDDNARTTCGWSRSGPTRRPGRVRPRSPRRTSPRPRR
jgi:hypothetical protein